MTCADARHIILSADPNALREQYVNVLPPEATPVDTFLTNPVKVQVGGAIAWVIDVERFARF